MSARGGYSGGRGGRSGNGRSGRSGHSSGSRTKPQRPRGSVIVGYQGDGYFNVLLTCTTLGAGFLAFWVGHRIFQVKQFTTSLPAIVGLCYLILFLFVGLAVILTVHITGSAQHEILFDNKPVFFLLMAGALIVSFLLAMLFQWLYGLGDASGSLIDRAGSIVDKGKDTLNKVLEGDASLHDIKAAVSSVAGRHLLGYRIVGGVGGFFLGVLRVLFLTILGAILGAVMSYATFFEPSITLSLICAGGTAFLGAVIMEICAQVFYSSLVGWVICWMLFAVVISNGPLLFGFIRSRKGETTAPRRR